MEEIVLKTDEDDGVDDAGTISFGQVEEEPERQGSEKGIYPASSIKIDRVQYSIFEMKRRYDRGNICLDPDFQRGIVWKPRQKSELIESVIMGIPLPLIYMAETMEGKLVIVDGRQRLTTFFDYMDNQFALNGLRILPELNRYKFEDLEKDSGKRKFAIDIEDFQLVIQIIKYPTPDRVRFDIFDRVNRGGTPLNNQEMRNALYQGKSTRLLKVLASTEEFKAATGYSISSTHMKDKYIILRAIGFYLWKVGFESLFCFIAMLLENVPTVTIGRISSAVSEMLEDSVFLQSLTYNVDSASSVWCRMQMVEKWFERIEAAEAGGEV